MEGSERSGGVLKKKNSSGCLIIKKKHGDGDSGEGLGGFRENSKERKRVRGVGSFSCSSDEEESLELMRRKVAETRLRNGSGGYRRDGLENRDNHRTGISSEAKRSRLDLFEFDEYDEFDGSNTSNLYLGSRFKMSGGSGKGHMKELGVRSSKSNLVVGKRQEDSEIGGSGSGRSKQLSGARYEGFELEDEDADADADMPISLWKLKCREKADQPIRFQGKNGVLKVMVNKNKKVDFRDHPSVYDSRDIRETKGCMPDDGAKEDAPARFPVCSATKLTENHGLSVDKEKSVVEMKGRNLEKVKPVLNKGSKSRDLEIDGTDGVWKLALPVVRSCSSKKGLEKKGVESPTPENVTPIEGNDANEGKFKHSGNTEKQMLREKVRGMLIEAGWTIDYRPRRNRDYLDSVYINPSGTAYWSIVKAYAAFRKQLEEDNGKSGAEDTSHKFTPLSDELISKLTRQTKLKIEDEIKRKRKDGKAKSAKRSAIMEAADSSDSNLSDGHVKQNYKSRSGKMHKVDQDNGYDSDDDLPKRKSGKFRKGKPSNVVQGRAGKAIGRCTLLARPSDKGEDLDSDGYIPYKGKRTILAWLIDTGVVKSSEKVQYMNWKRNRAMLEGWITRDGIHCSCCGKILTISKFELHAGSTLRQPFQNIFVESGSSLLQCQIDAWNSLEDSARRDFHFIDNDGVDPDDDACAICGDGGDLICCDSCPSTFHQLCLGIQMLPSGDWYCPNCTCNFCGHTDGNASDENDTTGDKLKTCSFCEKKYHKSCRADVDDPSVSSNGVSYCGIKCQELHDHLQKVLGVKHELEGGFSWTLIQRTDTADASHARRVECNSKLAVALSVMDECFLPIIDRRSGINIIRNVVYNCGSNFNRLNFRGFYMVILERGDEIVSAASIRLHGTHLAEMPFIGTRETYRRQGMCRRLLSTIENELASLKVEKLIIPAISEHMDTWTAAFGFHQLQVVDKKEMKSMNMLVFPGTDMLRKRLMIQKNSDGLKVSETKDDQFQSPIVKKLDIDSSPEHNRQASNTAVRSGESKFDDEADALDCSSPSPAIPSSCRNTSGIDSISESDNLHDNKGTTGIEPEVENLEKETSACLRCCPASDGSDMEQQLLDHPAYVGSSNREDAPEVTSKKGCIETAPGHVSETSSQTTAVNGHSDSAPCLRTVSGEKHLERSDCRQSQETAPASETELHPSLEHSMDSSNHMLFQQ